MTLKIISLNLWLGGILFEDILRFLERHKADVLVLQEVYNGQDASLDPQFRSMQVLQARLRYPYQDFVADFLDIDKVGGKAQRGNAILSRLPITAQNQIFLSGVYSEEYRDIPGNFHNCPRSLQHVALDTSAGEVNIFNIQGVWDLDGDNYSAQRRKMSETVSKVVEGLPNVILAGDTNAKQTNKAILDIEKYLKSVFGRELATTFNMRRKDNPGYATAAVDAILVSPTIKILTSQCPDVDISDHLPLLADLEIVRE